MAGPGAPESFVWGAHLAQENLAEPSLCSSSGRGGVVLATPYLTHPETSKRLQTPYRG